MLQDLATEKMHHMQGIRTHEDSLYFAFASDDRVLCPCCAANL